LNTFYLYSGSAHVNAEFPFGRITAAGLTEHFAVTITTTAWYTDMTILGGTLGFAATIPFGSDTNTAAVSFIGPLGFGRPSTGFPEIRFSRHSVSRFRRAFRLRH
jgi:hypothetical protein